MRGGGATGRMAVTARTLQSRLKNAKYDKSTARVKADQTKAVHIQNSIDAIDSWPTVRDGWMNLCAYSVFVSLFMIVIILGMQNASAKKGALYAMNNVIRDAVFDEYKTFITNENSIGDWWDYLFDENDPTQGWFGNIFPMAWYNGQNFTKDEAAMVMNYNKLVGGLLIVQKRGKDEPCVKPFYSGLDTAYQQLAPRCFTNTLIESDVPENLRGGGCASKVPWSSGVAAPPDRANVTASDPNKNDIYTAFCYSNEYNGFAVFLSAADGTVVNSQKLKDLKSLRWLDMNTLSLEVKFAVYNAHLRMFTFTSLNMGLTRAGVWGRYTSKNGKFIKVKSIDMEPFGLENPGEAAKLGLNLVFMGWVFYKVLTFLIRMFYAVRNFRRKLAELEAYNDGSVVLQSAARGGGTKEEVEKGRVSNTAGMSNYENEELDGWDLLETANLTLFIIFIVLRIRQLQLVFDDSRVIEVPANKYPMILEEVADQDDVIYQLNFFNICFCILRFFQFYEFQPSLAIVTKTLVTAIPDLAHFLAIFLAFLGLLAVMAHGFFGSTVFEFATAEESLTTCFIRMLAGLNLPKLVIAANASNGQTVATSFFFFFYFLLVIVLLNILLAIIVDSYSEALNKTNEAFDGHAPTVVSDLSVIVRRIVWNMQQLVSPKLPDQVVRDALVVMKGKLAGRQGHCAHICDPTALLEAMPAGVRGTLGKGAGGFLPAQMLQHPALYYVETHAKPVEVDRTWSDLVEVCPSPRPKALEADVPPMLHAAPPPKLHAAAPPPPAFEAAGVGLSRPQTEPDASTAEAAFPPPGDTVILYAPVRSLPLTTPPATIYAPPPPPPASTYVPPPPPPASTYVPPPPAAYAPPPPPNQDPASIAMAAPPQARVSASVPAPLAGKEPAGNGAGALPSLMGLLPRPREGARRDETPPPDWKSWME